MRSALRVEMWKLWRSRVPWATSLLMVVLIPAMGLGMLWAAERGGTGALGAKIGAFVSEGGWPGFVGVVDQIAAVAVFLGSGVVTAWVFGREFVDRTFPSLFARAVSKGTVALAKLVVLTLWVVVITLAMVGVTGSIGAINGLGGAELAEVVAELGRLAGVTAGAGILGLTVALVASVGRGYLPAIGVLIVVVAVAQVAVLLGTGAWFPYVVPGLLAVSGADGVPSVSLVQAALVPAIVIAAGCGTVVWWNSAEV